MSQFDQATSQPLDVLPATASAASGRLLRRAGAGVAAAITGNPNSGKTSLFNRLTGAIQSVANYPGVTVEQKIGRIRHDGHDITVVDLPGIYSLTAYSLEEVVARNYVIDSKPQVVVDVVDASNLERNLYLTVQLMEMRCPLVVVLNMIDKAEQRGLKIDIPKMSQLLGVPVVATMANRGFGLGDVTKAIVDTAEPKHDPTPRPVSYGHEVEVEVGSLTEVVARDAGLAARFPPSWVAVKLIDRDAEMRRVVENVATDPATVLDRAGAAVAAIETHFSDTAETILAERRYGFAAGVVRECVSATPEARRDLTERIDSVVCNKYLGPLLLLGVVYGLFAVVFKVADDWAWLFGRSPSGWVNWFFDDLLVGAVAPLGASMPMLHSLLRDGVIGGVGGVLSFVPLIATLFAFVAVLEDTGYVARVAFVLDRALRGFGLQGKSILSLIVSGGLGAGGCAVPGVMATRTLREEKDRIVTMLVAPLMNCGAKIPVYLMLIAAFFAHRQPLVMFVLWIASWVIALTAAWILRKTVVRGEQTPFVMELPAYHVPTLRGVLLHTWERTWLYIRKAGTVILAVSIVMWALMAFPRAEVSPTTPAAKRAEAQLVGSAAGRVGSLIEPVTQYAGFDWRDNIALIGGFAAKEVIVSTMGTAYSMGDVDPDASQTLSGRLAGDPAWTPLRAAALMAFVMVYAPCMSTMAVIRRESGKWRWPIFATTYATALGFVLALAVYQIGGLLGLGS
jgi:ferrous iron transport protein B